MSSFTVKIPAYFDGWHKMTAGKRLHAERFFQYSALFRWQNGGQRIVANGRKNRLADRRTVVYCKYYRGRIRFFQDGSVNLQRINYYISQLCEANRFYTIFSFFCVL